MQTRTITVTLWMLFLLVVMAQVLVADANAITKADAIRATELDTALLIEQDPELGVAEAAVIGCRKLRRRPAYRCISRMSGQGDLELGIDGSEMADWTIIDHRVVTGRSCRYVRIQHQYPFPDTARIFNTCALAQGVAS